MSDKRLRNYQLLELQDSASPEQVEVAYHQLLRRYGVGSLASYGLLRVDERRKFLLALKDAYQQITQRRHTSSQPPASDAPQDEPSEGDDLLQARELPGESKATEKAELVQAVAVAAEAEYHGAKEKGASNKHPNPGASAQLASLPQTPEPPGTSFGSSGHSASMATSQHAPSSFQQPTQPWVGARLATMRKQREVDLQEMAHHCQCEAALLRELERGAFTSFGSSRALREVLKPYANVLGIDTQRVLTDNLSAYWESRSTGEKQ